MQLDSALEELVNAFWGFLITQAIVQSVLFVIFFIAQIP